jgi:hypothetical protein
LTITLTLRIFPPSETGWSHGAPAHMPVEVVEADRRIYAQCRCPACGRRGLKTTAQHNGRRYRIFGECHRCGGVEVF